LLAVDRPIALTDRFERIEALPPAAVTLRGRTLKTVNVAVGDRLRRESIEQ
jgi:hypothetical protein